MANCGIPLRREPQEQSRRQEKDKAKEKKILSQFLSEFSFDKNEKVGTLISHGSMTCWNCTAGERGTHRITLRSLCEDLGGWGMGGVGLALNMFSELYQPANTQARTGRNYPSKRNLCFLQGLLFGVLLDS